MRDGFFNGQTQKMVYPDDHLDPGLRGKAKGMKAVLQERGLWDDQLLARCPKPREKETDVEPSTLKKKTNYCPADNDRCRAEKILSLQEDFRSQKPLLQEVHICMHYIID